MESNTITLESSECESDYLDDETEELINAFMDDIWNVYDTNKSGFLEKDQAIALMEELIFDQEDDSNL